MSNKTQIIDLEIRYNIDSIPAMAEQRRRVFESVTAGVQNGILTRKEAREQLGYETINGADSLLVPATLMPLNEASDETAPSTDEDLPKDLIEEENQIEELDLDQQALDEEIEEMVKAEKDIDTKARIAELQLQYSRNN